MSILKKIAKMMLVLVLAMSVAMAGEPAPAPVQKLTKEQAIAMALGSLNLHVKQRRLNAAITTRLLQEFAKRLDPYKTLYLQSEIDELTDKPGNELAKIAGTTLIRSDLSFFEEWIRSFKKTQLAREEAFIKSLKGKKDEVAKKLTAEEAESRMDQYPTSEDEINVKLMLLARATYEGFIGYLPADEAFDMTVKKMEDDLAKKSLIDPVADAPREFLKAFIRGLDPHSEYMDAAETAAMKEGLARSFSGVGVEIRSTLAGAVITGVFKGMPAEKSGQIVPGDQIVAVDGVSVAGVPLDQLVRKIKGAKGTEVKLTIRKAPVQGQEPQVVIVTLTRDTVEMADIKVRSEVKETPNGRIGYLHIDNFYEGMADDAAAKIKAMMEKPLAGLVLDLRNNGGGYLREAILLAGQFIHAGPIVASKGGGNVVQWDYDPDAGCLYEGPLVILVNQNSASASEVVAGTLSDYGRAIIVGPTQTYGKGTVQAFLDMGGANMPGMLRLTIKQYYVASGLSTQIKGVVPDITIPGWKLRVENLEKSLDGVIPEDKVDSTILANEEAKKYQAIKKRLIPVLTDASRARVSNERAFDVFKDEANRVEQKKDDPDPQKVEAINIAEDMAKSWEQPGE